jgi:hypothetical protein
VDEPKLEKVKMVPALEPLSPVSPTTPSSTPKPRMSRRTYSITDDVDVEIDTTETHRRPRAGWQYHRQHFTLDEEGDVSLKDRSPVRLPRAGQAPRREFSFSNLKEASKTQEIPSLNGKLHSLPDTSNGKTLGRGMGGLEHDILEIPEEETPKPKSRTLHVVQNEETIFHDLDSPSSNDVLKPSIGGGTGGRAEESIFVELAEDSQPHIQPKKSPLIRRDQQAHFHIGDEPPSPSTPVPVKTKHMSLQHFSIGGTPDPREEEHRIRALQKKEVNHFRPDTIPHFEIADFPEEDESHAAKKENSSGMNKLLQGVMGKSWMMGSDSPITARDRRGVSMPKVQPPNFTYPPNGEEKENGRSGRKKVSSVAVATEKEWWEA